MKKIIIASAFLIILVIANILNVNADDNDDESTYLNNYACHYYSNNDYNYIINETNSYCSFQSFGHLLMYWDSYWNDGFINDSHFVENDSVVYSMDELNTVYSPGILFYEYGYDLSLPNEEDEYWSQNSTFYNNVTMNVSPYKSMLSCMVDVYQDNSGNFNDVIIFGANFSEVYSKLIVPYFNSVYCTIGYDNLLANYNVYHEVLNLNEYAYDYKDQIIGWVSQGYPVLVGFYQVEEGTYNSGLSGHCCVVYDYDENSETLYAYTDVENNNQMELSKHYAIPNDAIFPEYFVIYPKNNDSHSHSYNYFVYDEMNDSYSGYCSCELNSHQHILNKRYFSIYNPTNCYEKYCFCGFSETYSHSYYSQGNKHYCNECGNDGLHRGLFIYNNQYYCSGKCAVCLLDLTLPHQWQINGTKKTCSLCGRTTLVETPIVKKKEEEEVL